MMWFLLLLVIVLILGNRPGPPRPRPWFRWHLAAPALVLLLAGCEPEPDPSPADLDLACPCAAPEVLGVVPFQFQLPPTGPPLPVLLQAWAVGGPFARLTPADVTFQPPTVRTSAISIRSPDNMLIWAEVTSAAEPTVDLVLRGRTALVDALLISP